MNKYAKGNVTMWNRRGTNTFIQIELGKNPTFDEISAMYDRFIFYYSTLAEKLSLDEIRDTNDELFFDCEKYMEEQVNEDH